LITIPKCENIATILLLTVYHIIKSLNQYQSLTFVLLAPEKLTMPQIAVHLSSDLSLEHTILHYTQNMVLLYIRYLRMISDFYKILSKDYRSLSGVYH